MVDALSSGGSVRKDVLVRIQSRAQDKPCKPSTEADLQGFLFLGYPHSTAFYRKKWPEYGERKSPGMNIKISAKPSRYTDKIFYYPEWGKTAGQRIATPADYYYKFKKALKAARSDGYFLESPAAIIKSKVKPNKNKKEMLKADEYIQLINDLV